MAEMHQSIKSALDTAGPIDFDKLRDSTQNIGPLRMRQSEHPYVIEMAVRPCGCADDDCENEVVLVERKNGLFSIRWIMEPDELRKFRNLDEFRLYVLAGGLDDTCGERQVIERDVEHTLGVHYSDIENANICLCGDCITGIGTDELARHMLLAQLAMRLKVRQQCLGEARETFGDEVEEIVSWAFDIGYQAGRIYSEYQVTEDIEKHAIAGLNFEELKAERARRAGAKSAGKRTERIVSLLAHMERLASDSPALLRISPEALARMAHEDASAENPSLWSQGGGQVEEYLGSLRRGEAGAEMRSRYLNLFPAQQRSLCRKTA